MSPILAQKTEEEKPPVGQHISIPQVQLTFNHVKRQIDEGRQNRPECPDGVAKAVLKSGNPQEKIVEVRKALDEIAKTAEFWADKAFRALSNDKVAALFVSHTKEFVEMAKAVGGWVVDAAFSALENDKIAGLFVEKPAAVIDAFGKIVKAVGSWAGDAFHVLSNDKVAALFVEKPAAVIDAIGKIAKATGIRAEYAFNALWYDEGASKFEEYCKKRITFEILMLNIKVYDYYAIELGRPLDDLARVHTSENEQKIRKYLATLSKMDVLALLLSNPEYFYTSSNHMLFDRLNNDFKPGELASFLKENKLEGTELHRNLIFRAANYDRLYGKYGQPGGKGGSIFSKSEMSSVLATISAPLEADGVDSKYYYLLANTLENLDENMKAHVREKIGSAQASLLLNEGKGEWVARKGRALHFLMMEIMNLGRREAIFEASNYCNKDGKLFVVQIFDKEDTEKDHWAMSQKWFSKYGKQKTGESGELIYETKNARIVLFMGETEEKNQEFLNNMLGKSPNMLLTFRGHSYSLNDNVPTNIFANRKVNILFIPGSCGSAGSTPAYMESNPNVSFEFVANTSIGMGQVTNALIDIFIDEAASGRKRSFKTIIKKDKSNCSLVEKNGGDCSTLKVDTLGERLIEYTRGADR